MAVSLDPPLDAAALFDELTRLGRRCIEENRLVGRLINRRVQFISKALDRWAYENAVTLDFSRPGKPTDNPYIESFNGSFRDECLNVHWFLSLVDAREKIETWRRDYNAYRPHQSLGGLSPEMFIAEYLKTTSESLVLSG